MINLSTEQTYLILSGLRAEVDTLNRAKADLSKRGLLNGAMKIEIDARLIKVVELGESIEKDMSNKGE